MDKRREIHDRVLNASNTEELAKAYSEWADDYDQDLIDEMGYVAPLKATQLFSDNVEDRSTIILDAGCGTGLVGECLRRHGYKNIEGLDYSRAMLEKAGQKQIYRKLTQGDLTGSLDIASNTFDAIISVGTFTCGHVGPEAFDELLRIAKPGGHICFTVRDKAWEEDSYFDKIGALQRNGGWTMLAESTTEYIKSDGSNCRICLYQVNKISR
ncbi:MAG: class I SAM-dependent methyltransferase [Desulforhopalus sp.]